MRLYLLAALLLCLVSAYAGYRLAPRPEATAGTNTQIVERVVTRTVTKTIKPDGTVTETVTEKQESTNTNTVARAAPAPKKWAIEAQTAVPPKLERPRPDYSFTAWRRVSDTPAWIGVGWDMNKHAVLAGLRMEF